MEKHTVGESHGYPKNEARIEAPSDDTALKQRAEESNLKQDKKENKKRKTNSMPEAADSKLGHLKSESQSKDKKKKKGKNKSKEKRNDSLASRAVKVHHQDGPTTEEISEDAVDKQKEVSKKRKRRKTKATEETKMQEVLGQVRGSTSVEAVTDTSKEQATYYTKYQAECSMLDADYVRFEGLVNPYGLIHFCLPEQTEIVEVELKRLCRSSKTFPNFRKLSDLCVATERRGMSLRLFLREYKEPLFFGPTLLKLRNVLIDLIEGFKHLMDARIKSVVSLDNIYVDVGASGLHLTFTQFVCRPGATQATNEEWTEFADFVIEINKACGYIARPTMLQFLRCLNAGGIGGIPEASELEEISEMPLFWDGAKRVRFFLNATEAYLRRDVGLIRSGVTLPNNWKTRGSNIKLGELLGRIPLGGTNEKNALNCLNAFRNEIAHFVCKADEGYPNSREDLLLHMEKLIPSLMPMLICFVKENADQLGMHLPRGETRLRGLSK